MPWNGFRPRLRRLADSPLGRLHAIVGTPGLLVGLFSMVALAFGLVILAREYDRLRKTGREALRPIIGEWVRTMPVHYLGWTLVDYADAWRRAPESARAERQAELSEALDRLGSELDLPVRRSPLIEIVAMDLGPRTGPVLASWRPNPPKPPSPSDLTDRVAVLTGRRQETPVDLAVRYRVAPEIERAGRRLEDSYRRLLLALLGLSGYPLLCLGAMALQARVLRDRAARESAQAATLDLADRTCHELGNVAFVLSNEGHNLSDHLDLLERFIAEDAEALSAAARRAGLDPSQAERFQKALRREYADRGIDPSIELFGGVSIARDVCRQVAVCSDYIALTVRELDGYLKQSALPVTTRPVAVSECLDDALALLNPRLEAAATEVIRPEATPPTCSPWPIAACWSTPS